jgi:uncharacterized protein (TIGR02453 family)
MNLDKNILKFLSELKTNNNRDWFILNKNRFIEIQNELVILTGALLSEIEKFDPNIKGTSPKDCIFRIYKDVRFAHDKSPYKTNLGIFIKNGGKRVTGSGYYLHIEPGLSFLGGGCHEPDPKSLQKIREAIASKPETLNKIIRNKTFVNEFGTEFYGEKLKSAPRGFAKDHPEIELLKNKSFTVIKKLKDSELTSNSFLHACIKSYKIISPLNQYLDQILSRKT